MKRKSLLSVLLLLLAISLYMSGCGQKPAETSAPVTPSSPDSPKSTAPENKEKIKLTYAFFAPANTFPAVQAQQWADELTARTEGQVEVQLFLGGSLLDAANMYEGVRNGVVDIGLSALSYEPGIFPLHGISDLPSGHPNAAVSSQVFFTLLQEYPPEAFADFKIITGFTTEPSYIQTKTKVSTLEDLAGQQLRISGSLTPIAQALGASPVGMSQAESAEALQTGIINGAITSREVLLDLKLAEFTKYVVDYPLVVTSFAAVMDKEKWESLPANVQEVIDELSMEMALFAGEYLDNHVQESLDWSAKEHGLEIVSLSAEERQRWDEIIKPIQDNYVAELEAQGLPAKEYQTRLYELLELYGK